MSNEIIDRNRKLCACYPYLIPRNILTGEIVNDYDYSYIMGDFELPIGWHTLFLQFCKDIKQPLVDANYLNEFRFAQLKEKYGTLQIYHFGAPEEVQNIIDKYEYISQFVCVDCGSLDAQMYNYGWVSPRCKQCFKKTYQDNEVDDKFIIGGKFKNSSTLDVLDEWERLKERRK